MQSILAVLLVAILNMLPAGVKEFTLTMPDAKSMQFVHQTDGGWKGLKAAPKQDDPVFYVAGTQFTMKSVDKEFTNDLAPTLGLAQGTNWQELQELKVGPQTIRIERQSGGVDFVIDATDPEGKKVERRFVARWVVPSQPK